MNVIYLYIYHVHTIHVCHIYPIPNTYPLIILTILYASMSFSCVSFPSSVKSLIQTALMKL